MENQQRKKETRKKTDDTSNRTRFASIYRASNSRPLPTVSGWYVKRIGLSNMAETIKRQLEEANPKEMFIN